MDVKPDAIISKQGKVRFSTAPRLKAIIRNADHRCRHDGLAVAVKKHTGIDVDTLDNGEFVLLMNTSRRFLTLYGPNRIMVQQKLSRPITDERALMYLPEIFLSKERLMYDSALQKYLYEAFPKWKKEDLAPVKTLSGVIVRKRREASMGAVA